MPQGEIKRLRTGLLASDDALVTLGLAVLGPQYSVYDVCEQDYRLAKDYQLVVSAHTGGGPMLAPGSFEKLIELNLIDDRHHIYGSGKQQYWNELMTKGLHEDTKSNQTNINKLDKKLKEEEVKRMKKIQGGG